MTILKTTSLMAVISVLGASLIAGPVDAGSKKKKKTKEPVAPMVFDIQKRKKTKNDLAPNLKYSAYAQVLALREGNIKRDDDVTDKRGQNTAYVGLVLRGDFGPVTAFAHGQFSAKSRFATGRTYPSATKSDLKEGVVSVSLGGGHLTAGRLRFSDAHKWLADAAVDGVHYGHKTKGRGFELALVQGTRKNTAQYAMAHISRADERRRWGAMALAEQDGAAQRLHLAAYDSRIISARFSQTWNVALVAGDAANNHKVGLGADWRGMRKVRNGKAQWTFGLAFGTEGFQHTGLQSNKTYDKGQTQFNRYGFVFQPKLTNLAVGTIAYGLRPSRKFSMDFAAHVYAQPSKSDTAPNARIKGDMTGRSSFVGGELSVVGAWRPSKKTKVEFGAGRFLPGPAYQDRSPATRVFTRFSISF